MVSVVPCLLKERLLHRGSFCAVCTIRGRGITYHKSSVRFLLAGAGESEMKIFLKWTGVTLRCSDPRQNRKSQSALITQGRLAFKLVSLRGIEPPAYRLGGGRSIQLSYRDRCNFIWLLTVTFLSRRLLRRDLRSQAWLHWLNRAKGNRTYHEQLCYYSQFPEKMQVGRGAPTGTPLSCRATCQKDPRCAKTDEVNECYPKWTTT